MVYYLFLPVFSLLLIVFQTTVLDLFFMGKVGLELSLVLVVYAGFYLNIIKGGAMSFILGFYLDCVTGSIPGLFTFIYVAIFFLSRVVSLRVYMEGLTFIMVFTFTCAFSEGIATILIYEFFLGVDMFHNILRVFLPQALVIGVLSPALFAIFSRFEVLLNGGEARQINRT